VKIETKQFGNIEIDEGKVYTMPDGMPGFLGMKRFVIIDREETWPFHCYQCLDDPGLSFFIMNPYLFKADYKVDMRQAAIESGWEGDDTEDIKLYVIVNTSAGSPEKITANLIGPLVINARRFEAVQLIIHNSPYSHQYRIFETTGNKPKPDRQDTVPA
jgi:flagellar assembly factor FliW